MELKWGGCMYGCLYDELFVYVNGSLEYCLEYYWMLDVFFWT